MTKHIALLLALVLSSAAPVRAIELSLEENRAERGNIGYIDMPRLFKQFPETVRARENFEEILRQTEDQINLRKVELLKLRNELSQLRMEREIMAKAIPMSVAEPKAAAQKGKDKSPEPAPAPAPAPKTQTPAQADLEALKASEKAQAPAPAAPAGGQDLSGLPGFAEAPKPAGADGPAAAPSGADGPAAAAPTGADGAAAPAQPDSLVINIPGVSTAPVVVQEPQSEPVSAGKAAQQPQPVSQPAAQPQPAVPAGAAPADSAAGNPTIVELDAKIALRARELEQKDAEFKRYQAEQEKNLLDLESRKTEVLLGKIHRAVQEVARREGVSVVVDKTSILYGHDAVDLTEKVLKFLRGT